MDFQKFVGGLWVAKRYYIKACKCIVSGGGTVLRERIFLNVVFSMRLPEEGFKMLVRPHYSNEEQNMLAERFRTLVLRMRAHC